MFKVKYNCTKFQGLTVTIMGIIANILRWYFKGRHWSARNVEKCNSEADSPKCHPYY